MFKCHPQQITALRYQEGNCERYPCAWYRYCVQYSTAYGDLFRSTSRNIVCTVRAIKLNSLFVPRCITSPQPM